MSQSLFPPKMSAVINMMAFYPSEKNADISADPYRGDYSPPTIGVIRPVYFRLRFSIDHQNTFATSGSDPSPSFFRFARAAREMTELCAKKCFPIRKRKKKTHTECIEKRDHRYVCPDKFRAVSPSDGTSHPPPISPPLRRRRRRRHAHRNVRGHGRIGVRAGGLVVVSEDDDRGRREDERTAVDRCLFELGRDVEGCAMRGEGGTKMVNMYKARGGGAEGGGRNTRG